MNQDTDSFNELKKLWAQQTVRIEQLEVANQELCNKLKTRKVLTSQQRLSRDIKIKSILGLVMVAISPLIWIAVKLPVWYGLTYAFSGCIVSILNYYIVRYINAEDLISIPVADAVLRITRIRNFISRVQYLSVFLLLLLIGFGAVLLANHTEAIIGGAVCGLVVGLIIGVVRLVRQNRLLKQMTESISE